ncbi:MAG: 3-hydroxyacyl-[acyl-carrier-protein] dehydratase FabZ [Omnitrophica bacterium RBG_13_46_9]|nr:MAG: 3-hydroxyacyl-[acyl-carrier-protein] dehydratase FabZ [Omnitrophica bacterium RBG_13_46_9]
MDIDKIKRILPQRYPFLFIDKIIEFEKDVRLTALKNVTVNEEYFKGHFPAIPVMPGVLLIEAMGQAAIIFLNLNNESDFDKPDSPDIYYLCAVKARFLHPVKPGDSVIIDVTPVKLTKNSGIIKAVAKVDGREVARAELTGAKQR